LFYVFFRHLERGGVFFCGGLYYVERYYALYFEDNP
jgi:hypothetical protein